jgi:hypothetical protein
MEEAWLHILYIYENILKNDKYWHFFYECKYSIIRCSRKYKKKVKEYLEINNIKHEYNGPWIDGSYIVETYKEEFINLFHEFSMLAVKLDEKLLNQTADRVCHCFLNHCTYMAETYRKNYGQHGWESYLMGRLAADRAYYIGRLDTILGLKERAQKDPDKLIDELKSV